MGRRREMLGLCSDSVRNQTLTEHKTKHKCTGHTRQFFGCSWTPHLCCWSQRLSPGAEISPNPMGQDQKCWKSELSRQIFAILLLLSGKMVLLSGVTVIVLDWNWALGQLLFLHLIYFRGCKNFCVRSRKHGIEKLPDVVGTLSMPPGIPWLNKRKKNVPQPIHSDTEKYLLHVTSLSRHLSSRQTYHSHVHWYRNLSLLAETFFIFHGKKWRRL